MRSYRKIYFGAPLEAVESGTPEPTGTQVLLRVTAPLYLKSRPKLAIDLNLDQRRSAISREAKEGWRAVLSRPFARLWRWTKEGHE